MTPPRNHILYIHLSSWERKWMQCSELLCYKQFHLGIQICNLLFMKSAWANLSQLAVRAKTWHLWLEHLLQLNSDPCKVLPSYGKQKYYWGSLGFWRLAGFWSMWISAFLHHRKIKLLSLLSCSHFQPRNSSCLPFKQLAFYKLNIPSGTASPDSLHWQISCAALQCAEAWPFQSSCSHGATCVALILTVGLLGFV